MEPTGYPELDGLLPRLAGVAALDAQGLESERIAVLGRKQGALTFAMKALAILPPEERKRFGAEVNRIKQAFEAALAARAEAAPPPPPASTSPSRGEAAGSVLRTRSPG